MFQLKEKETPIELGLTAVTVAFLFAVLPLINWLYHNIPKLF
jgi:hypothetical protein